MQPVEKACRAIFRGSHIRKLRQVKHVQQRQLGLMFLSERNRVRGRGDGFARKIRGVENIVKLDELMRRSANMRADGQHGTLRTTERFFRNGAEHHFFHAFAAVRANH